jgi:hypothetical protein
MANRILLKTKSSICVLILGILNFFAFSFITGCSNNTTNKNDNTADSLERVKKMHDSIAKEKHKLDSIADAKRVQDSIAREDSIKKIKQIKENYKPVNHAKKYGVRPTDFKKIN